MQYVRTFIRQEVFEKLPENAQEVLREHLKGLTIIPCGVEVVGDMDSLGWKELIKNAVSEGIISVDPLPVFELYGDEEINK